MNLKKEIVTRSEKFRVLGNQMIARKMADSPPQTGKPTPILFLRGLLEHLDEVICTALAGDDLDVITGAVYLEKVFKNMEGHIDASIILYQGGLS